MNAKQLDIISKSFNVTDDFYLTRGEFEGFPCPMVACLWTDEQMEELTNRVKGEFSYDHLPTNSYELENLEEEWYRVIEKCAIDMGMKYYEDLSDEELEEIENKWENIK
jgi:hypothetical protein